MRVFLIANGQVTEQAVLPTTLPEGGFWWVTLARREFEVLQADVQAMLAQLCDSRLVDLHVSDLLNNQLPSHHDFTSVYDVLVFRRLATSQTETDLANPGQPVHVTRDGSMPRVFRRINTNPVGFAVFDRLLLSIHPANCAVRDGYAERLLASHALDARTGTARLPASPPDLMLRVVNQMVDGYLELRRELTRDMDRWQEELLDERGRFHDWRSMMHTRLSLHMLDEVCEDQRSAIQDWIEAVHTWAPATDKAAKHERELLLVRSRDVLEHIERVIHHVDRLERSAETAVQMHFSVQGSRTNDTMKTLTALTAIFLPLNLVTGFFGMNFEFLPLIHDNDGLWWAVAVMVGVATVLGWVFWRRRYLARR
ncbi:MAG: magnesium transporter CorA family protein [Burkholderiaceae bacterium]